MLVSTFYSDIDIRYAWVFLIHHAQAIQARLAVITRSLRKMAMDVLGC